MPAKRPAGAIAAAVPRGLLKKARKRLERGKGTPADLALLQSGFAAAAAAKAPSLGLSRPHSQEKTPGQSNEQALFHSVFGNARPRVLFQESYFDEKQRDQQITSKEFHNLLFWVLTESMGTKPGWVFVDNKALIPCVVLVVVDAPSPTAGNDQPAFTKETDKAGGDVFVRMRISSPHHSTPSITGNGLPSVVERLLLSESSSAEKKKQLKQRRSRQTRPRRERCTIEDLIMTQQQREQHGYNHIKHTMTLTTTDKSSNRANSGTGSPERTSSLATTSVDDGGADQRSSNAVDSDGKSEVWIDGKFGGRRCRDGIACADPLCGFAHPMSWPHQPSTKTPKLKRLKITRQLTPRGTSVIKTTYLPEAVVLTVRPVEQDGELASAAAAGPSASTDAGASRDTASSGSIAHSSSMKAASVFALDCEMVETELNDPHRSHPHDEVARVTIVDVHGTVVLDELICPSEKIVDYRTQWSGLSESSLKGVTQTLADVQAKIRAIPGLDSRAILVGHSLNCDLEVLQWQHDRIVDTAALFPHHKGLPFKQSLRHLVKKHLRASVKGAAGGEGHDSAEDARAALALVKLKMKRGISYGLVERLPRVPLLQVLRASGNLKYSALVAHHDSQELASGAATITAGFHSVQHHRAADCAAAAMDQTASSKKCPSQMAEWLASSFKGHKTAMGTKMDIPFYCMAIDARRRAQPAAGDDDHDDRPKEAPGAEATAAGTGSGPGSTAASSSSCRDIFVEASKAVEGSLPTGTLVLYVAPSALTAGHNFASDGQRPNERSLQRNEYCDLLLRIVGSS